MRNRASRLILALAFLGLAPLAARAEEATAKMTLLSAGAMPKLGGYRPQRLEMSPTKPDSLKKAPDLTTPLYGELKFGGKSYLVVVDEPAGKTAKLYVDSNGNGDLTDDAPVTWTDKPYTLPNNTTKYTEYSGSIKLPLQSGDKQQMVSLGAYRFDKNDAMRGVLKNTLLYYSDYAMEGEINLGGKTYHAMLSDDFATGDFSGKSAAGEAAAGGARNRLLIDRDGDGRFDPRFEVFDASKPFNIDGTTWALKDLNAGGTFAVAKSNDKVEEIMPPPDHSVGKVITAFTAKTTDGKTVNFPGDYKGKIVMLDFWATWCGPCMAEVPNLVTVYKEYHPKGIEILGISLDQPNSADKVKKVTADSGMTWPQVYDGKFWKADVAVLYGVESIPSAYLVDGDTGKVIAAGGALRGDNLAETYKAAAEKKAGSKQVN
ncbi:MAG TPA: redoxin domain-containing protein [Humisphaera sp.]|jgi:thiol-disulfide isomerase/thioredoxin|nr:redoxin domain-containing protein [Humisphaera sp.]